MLIESRPARGAWIEIPEHITYAGHYESRPARGAWIEIAVEGIQQVTAIVAPRTGRVD